VLYVSDSVSKYNSKPNIIINKSSSSVVTTLNNKVFIFPNSFTTSSSSSSLDNEFFNIVNTFNKDVPCPLKY